MKAVLVLALVVLSSQSFAQSHGQGKAVNEILPPAVRAHDAIKSKKMMDKKNDKKTEAPCDSKEDILKKLEEEKKAREEAGKGLSLQGKTDAGCTVK